MSLIEHAAVAGYKPCINDRGHEGDDAHYPYESVV